ncbi:MAG: DUF2905 domain-containing protein [Chloroflexi bacterium]|nr:DUF2905 domain-containing protein [Chloroflexota bacterium]
MVPGLVIAGRALMVAGGVLFVLGLLLLLVGRVPGVGRLPGDILFQKGSFSFYFPLMTSLLVSLILTFVLGIIFRFLKS